MHDDEAAAPEPVPSEARRRPRRIHVVRWLILGLLVTAGYWIASYSVRPAAQSWLSRTLGSPVKVVRVGFDPIDAVITLEGLVTRLPSEGNALGPPIVAERARIDLQWFPLVHKRLQVREFTLEGAVITLDEAPNLVPSLETLGAPARPKTLPDGWTVQVDRVALRDSTLKLRSLSTGTEPLTISVHEAEVTAMRRRTSQLGAAKNLKLDASFEGGNLRAEGHYSLRDDGLAVMADVRASDVPVDRVLQHLPQIDNDSLSGRLEAEMRYVLEPDHRNMLTGWARMRDAKIHLPGAEEPSAEVRNAIADIAALDLRRRRVHVRSLVLRGTTLQPESQLGATILSSLKDERRGRTLRGRKNAPTVPAWRWSVDRFDATGAQLRVPGPADEEFDVVATIRGENLGPRSHWSPVHATFRHGLGSAEFVGSVRTSYEEPRLEGQLSAKEVDLPAFAHEVGLNGANLIRSGRISANVDVLLEPGSAGFGLNGIISVIGPSVVGRPPEPPPKPETATGAHEAGAPAPVAPAVPVRSEFQNAIGPRLGLPGEEEVDLLETFALGAARIDIAVNTPAPEKRTRGPQPERLWHFDATLTRPYLHVARDEDGWVLPSLGAPEEEKLEASADTNADAGALAAAGNAATRPSPVPLSELLRPVTIGRLAVVSGHIRLTDESAEPPLVIDVDEISGTATELEPSPFEAQELFLQGYGADLGLLEIRGNEATEWNGLEVAGEEIPLYLAGPYLERLGVPYRFSGGMGSFVSELRHEPDGWTADTLLVLNQPDVDRWTEATVPHDKLGMPLASAFRLLRDQNGDVRIRVPSLANLEEQFDVAVYDAIQGAHQAPSSGGALTPTTVGFAPGQSDLKPVSRSRLRSIARLVASQPRLRIELAAPMSLQDLRWFRERAVLTSLDERGGLMGALRLLGATDEKERIRRALQARVGGKSWYLESYEEEVLQELLSQQPPASPRDIRALAGRRLSAIEKLFLQEGIPYGRLARREVTGDGRTTLAAVLVTVRAPARPTVTRSLPAPDDDV
ncbi:MAG: DUF748 domain-containing protein [Candidatus Binatia bacterium]|nr:DUF748 domain-containing protein [Candidatus Binatia bacterium]